MYWSHGSPPPPPPPRLHDLLCFIVIFFPFVYIYIIIYIYIIKTTNVSFFLASGAAGGALGRPSAAGRVHRQPRVRRDAMRRVQTPRRGRRESANRVLGRLAWETWRNSVVQNRPFDLLVFLFWSIFVWRSQKLTFYVQVLWASEESHPREPRLAGETKAGREGMTFMAWSCWFDW